MCGLLGRGGTSHVLDKEYAISNLPDQLNVMNTKCNRNDNFDPNEPTLGAYFPARSAKSAKSTGRY